MLGTRIVTAVVLLLAFSIDLFFATVDVFALVLAFVVAAAAWEWGRLCGLVNEHLQTGYAAAVGLLVLGGLYLPQQTTVLHWPLLIGFLFWLAAGAVLYLIPVKAPILKTDWTYLLLGILVILIASVAVQYLRSYAPYASPWLLLYSLAVIWTMDTGAYFSGRYFGKIKLAPLISPGKTREGVYGGLLVTGLLMLIVLLSADWAADNRLKLIIATVLAAFASVLGDLFESRIKRAADRKDSSQLLPGHGGVLDRIDSVLAAVPVFAFAWAWL